MPFFSEATQSAARIVQLQSQRFRVQIEDRARRELKRGILVMATAALLQCALILGGYWITQELYYQGWEILRRQLKHWTWLFKSPLLAALIAGTIVYAFLKVFHHREPAARTLKSDS